jgi:histidine triad (HIT) family protein
MTTVQRDDHCIFCKIIAGQIPCKKVYEDDEIFAFHDINPAAPVHFLMVPKAHIESLNHLHSEHAELLGRMLALAPQLAAEQGCRTGREGGFRVIVNTGLDGGQEVFHLHVHVMGGQRPWKR